MRPSILVLLALIVPLAACDNSSNSSGVTTPSGPLTSQTFTGTVPVGGSSSNTSFVVATSGEVDVTVSALGPPANIFMGLVIGIPSATDGSCAAPTGSGAQVQASTTPLVTSETAGTYCVKLYDIGFMTAPVSYTVIVAHP